MIIKRFYRKRNNKIYLILCIFIISILFLFNGYINYINQVLNIHCQENSFMLMITEYDALNKLKKENDLYSIQTDKLIFEIDEESKYFTHIGYILENDLGRIKESKPDTNKLYWEDFMTLDHLLVSYDSNLNDNEAYLYYNGYIDEEKKEYSINKKLDVIYQNEKYNFKIKDIKNSNLSEIKISKNLYDKLYKIKNSYTYLISFKSEKSLNEFYDNSEYKYKPLFKDVNIDANYDKSQYKEILTILKDWQFLIYVIVIVILFIITLNMTRDEKMDIKLDYILGYNKKQIKLNLLIIYFIFTFIVIILSIIFSYFIKMFLMKYIQFELNICNVLLYSLMLFITLIIDVISIRIK